MNTVTSSECVQLLYWFRCIYIRVAKC